MLIIIYEVMADELDRNRWRNDREQLRQCFKQDELVIRSSSAELL
jgi:hypothetical protein